jgi:hypothetical protein
MGFKRASVLNNGVGSDAGFSMAVTVLSMGVVAILTALLLTTTLTSSSGSSSGSATGIDNAPGVAEATSLQAQQTLSTALTAVNSMAASAGYGSLSASTLEASNPSISFVNGTSSNAITVSISVVSGTGAGGAGAVGASGTSGAAGGIEGVEGAAVAGDGGGGVSGAGGGSVTLADRATGGTCWLVWKSADTATWYGAQTDQPSCTAPALASTPVAGPVSSTSIGWQQGSFPAP